MKSSEITFYSMQRMLELVLLRDHVGRLAAKLVLTVAVLKKTLTIVIPDLECKAKTARESIVSKESKNVVMNVIPCYDFPPLIS